MSSSVSSSSYQSSWALDYFFSRFAKYFKSSKIDKLAHEIFSAISLCHYEMKFSNQIEKYANLKDLLAFHLEKKMKLVTLIFKSLSKGTYEQDKIFKIESESAYGGMTGPVFYEKKIKEFFKSHPMRSQMVNLLYVKQAFKDINERFKVMREWFDEETCCLQYIIAVLTFDKQISPIFKLNKECLENFILQKAAVCTQEKQSPSITYTSWSIILLRWAETSYKAHLAVANLFHLLKLPIPEWQGTECLTPITFQEFLVDQSYVALLQTLNEASSQGDFQKPFLLSFPKSLRFYFNEFFSHVDNEFIRKSILLGYTAEYRESGEWRKIVQSSPPVLYFDRFLRMVNFLNGDIELASEIYDHLFEEDEFVEFQTKVEEISVLSTFLKEEVRDQLDKLNKGLASCSKSQKFSERKSEAEDPQASEKAFEYLSLRVEKMTSLRDYLTLDEALRNNKEIQKIFYQAYSEESWISLGRELKAFSISKVKWAANINAKILSEIDKNDELPFINLLIPLLKSKEDVPLVPAIKSFFYDYRFNRSSDETVGQEICCKQIDLTEAALKILINAENVNFDEFFEKCLNIERSPLSVSENELFPSIIRRVSPLPITFWMNFLVDSGEGEFSTSLRRLILGMDEDPTFAFFFIQMKKRNLLESEQDIKKDYFFTLFLDYVRGRLASSHISVLLYIYESVNDKRFPYLSKSLCIGVSHLKEMEEKRERRIRAFLKTRKGPPKVISNLPAPLPHQEGLDKSSSRHSRSRSMHIPAFIPPLQLSSISLPKPLSQNFSPDSLIEQDNNLSDRDNTLSDRDKLSDRDVALSDRDNTSDGEDVFSPRKKRLMVTTHFRRLHSSLDATSSEVRSPTTSSPKLKETKPKHYRRKSCMDGLNSMIAQIPEASTVNFPVDTIPLTSAALLNHSSLSIASSQASKSSSKDNQTNDTSHSSERVRRGTHLRHSSLNDISRGSSGVKSELSSPLSAALRSPNMSSMGGGFDFNKYDSDSTSLSSRVENSCVIDPMHSRHSSLSLLAPQSPIGQESSYENLSMSSMLTPKNSTLFYGQESDHLFVSKTFLHKQLDLFYEMMKTRNEYFYKNEIKGFIDVIRMIWVKYPLTTEQMISLTFEYFPLVTEKSIKEEMSGAVTVKYRERIKKGAEALKEQFAFVENLIDIVGHNISSSIIYYWLLYRPKPDQAEKIIKGVNADCQLLESAFLHHVPLMMDGTHSTLISPEVIRLRIHKRLDGLSEMVSSHKFIATDIDIIQEFKKEMQYLQDEILSARAPKSFQFVSECFIEKPNFRILKGGVEKTKDLRLFKKNNPKGLAFFNDWIIPGNKSDNPILVISILNLTNNEGCHLHFKLPLTIEELRTHPEVIAEICKATVFLGEDGGRETLKELYELSQAHESDQDFKERICELYKESQGFEMEPSNISVSKNIQTFVETLKKQYYTCLTYLARRNPLLKSFKSSDCADLSNLRSLNFSAAADEMSCSFYEEGNLISFSNVFQARGEFILQEMVDDIINSSIKWSKSYYFAERTSQSEKEEKKLSKKIRMKSDHIQMKFDPENCNEVTLKIGEYQQPLHYHELIAQPNFADMLRWQITLLVSRIAIETQSDPLQVDGSIIFYDISIFRNNS